MIADASLSCKFFPKIADRQLSTTHRQCLGMEIAKSELDWTCKRHGSLIKVPVGQ
ncbi:predicted protein [Plenodomus lingam JN3]|uniref:Predicted protein n=1 Tax=Leptosphaeria maculans (strain JN3 / isolate v23.1.3 / race Av1-4-5-6-7-8) TaxID=985895 RepID=E5A8N2_LEPMJ|nr:predicted protein [Plenodomus lingam JN3]CBX99977.1 predicted protein [Plenodomus lingam JN3]